MITGIDVSKAQGVVDWDSVGKAGNIAFAFCKATEGTSYTDPQLKNNWQGMKRIGLPCGTYHFAHPDNDPIAEADYYVNAVISSGAVEKGDMLVLDIEKETNMIGVKFTNWVLAFLQRVESKTGITPIVYTGGPYFNQKDGTPTPEVMSQLAHFPLWLAAYTNDPTKFIPDEWKSLGWKFWQCSGDFGTSAHPVIKLPGTNINVDCDLFDGTIEDLKAFANSLCTPVTDTFTNAINSVTNS